MFGTTLGRWAVGYVDHAANPTSFKVIRKFLTKGGARRSRLYRRQGAERHLAVKLH
jgi:hypothetical protein